MAESSEGRSGGGSSHDGRTVGDRDDTLISAANALNIMRKGLPKDYKIDDEAQDFMRECVSGFIRRVTSKADQRCKYDHRGIISGDDILYSLKNLKLDNYHELCEIYLKKQRGEEDMLRKEKEKHRQIVMGEAEQTGGAAAVGGIQEMTGNEDTEAETTL